MSEEPRATETLREQLLSNTLALNIASCDRGSRIRSLGSRVLYINRYIDTHDSEQ